MTHGHRSVSNPWWRHQMEIFSALLAICAGNSPVTGEFHTQRLVTRSFDVFFDLRPNKRLSKHSWGWWFETPSHPLWRHRNFYIHPWEVLIGIFLGILRTIKYRNTLYAMSLNIYFWSTNWLNASSWRWVIAQQYMHDANVVMLSGAVEARCRRVIFAREFTLSPKEWFIQCTSIGRNWFYDNPWLFYLFHISSSITWSKEYKTLPEQHFYY